jgi:hypothetical protein
VAHFHHRHTFDDYGEADIPMRYAAVLKMIVLSFMVIDSDADADSTFTVHIGKTLAKHG